MIERDEMSEAKFLYACASMKVAIASFLEVYDIWGGTDGGVVAKLDAARDAVDELMRA